MLYSILFVVPFIPKIVQAANDWTKPCLQGVCSYDLPASTNASGSVQLSGSPYSISDITPAAGWVILGCDPNALAQSLRLVCQSDEETTCDHLFQPAGAAGKLIRLPENCGKGPFARVANEYISDDQSIPSSIAARLIRRNGAQPEVHSLDIDTNFSAVDSSKMGAVSVAILGSTVPGVDVSTIPTVPQRRSRFAHRSLFSSVLDGISQLSNSINVNKTDTLPPININNDFPLLNGTVACSGETLSVEADVDTDTNAVVSIGVVASGTIIPPSLSDFALVAGLTATINGTLNIETSATGTVSSGVLTLFQVGLPGFDIPGILTIGPSFKVNAQTTATLDVDLNLKVGLSYNVNNAQLFFPPSSELQSGGDFAPGDTPLAISVSPSVASTGTITAHLIPTVDFGLDALGGIASATIFLDLDASATVELSLGASTSLNTTADSNSSSTASSTSEIPSSVSSSSSATSTSSPSSAIPAKRRAWNNFNRRSPYHHRARNTRRDNVSVAPVDVNGCINVGTGFNVNAGAQGAFFDIFNDTAQVTLFNKNFGLFNQCVGSAINTRRTVYSPTRGPLSKRTTLTCPGPDISNAVSVIDELVSAASIIAL